MIEAQDSGAGPAVHSQDYQALDSEWCFFTGQAYGELGPACSKRGDFSA